MTSREQRYTEPDLAIEEWLDYAITLEVDCIELQGRTGVSERGECGDVGKSAVLQIETGADMMSP